ncbi:ATP-dependent DNA helicase [Echinimonas agarilytica]|uniref:DNA 5'-3' helicase n=1 Tax=Echinimonas agarilytica TaxID=1215918 RepID=A0AA41W664_9GAMM|nr:ATP-dependent DNA helicase [Echinimonas agarilytica]MCM2679427.1 ATP-dependent DNA helicase [Echinimonas agarilytica]
MKAAKCFSKDGSLAKNIDQFRPRDSQIQMAEAVETAINQKGKLVVEAGTGTGKTFAYLVPALLSKGKTVISTGTKALQEQLFHRDLPTMIKALELGRPIALLKGRSNYLCRYRMDLHLKQADTVLEKDLQADIVTVKRWANTTESGDIGELNTLPEESRVYPFVTSTQDNCLGRECQDYEDCYLVKARKKAQEADVVVINHHLFFADMAIKDTGFGELLPDVDTLIFDEAHQLPDIATLYFGTSLSTRQLTELSKDVEVAYRSEASDQAQLAKAGARLGQAAQDLRLCFPRDPSKGNWREQMKVSDIQRAVKRLSDDLSFLFDVLKLALGRGKLIDQCWDRCSQYTNQLKAICATEELGNSYWFETTPRHLSMNLTPLDIASRFADFMAQKHSSWVFTSATLKVGDGFGHFSEQMGLSQTKELSLPSPFDYPTQSLLYVPSHLPEPVGGQPTPKNFVEAIMPLIDASPGGVFVLFTSHRMMHQVSAEITEKLVRPVLVQGKGSKQVLLDEFVNAGNAVLLATGSFWEGVDVRGEALSCVIIDKLPFGAPDDPLLSARIEDCRRSGGDAFGRIQIPQAVITLKQGAGRLIRDVSDRGLLAICDSRLASRGYGKTFLSSLPNMPRTRQLQTAVNFLKQQKDS